jgi:hypothetical protein
MIYHVIVRVGARDGYVPEVGEGEAVIPFSVEALTQQPYADLDALVWEWLDLFSLSAPQPAIELFRAAAAVYAADLRVSRGTSYDGWTREFVLHVPVSDPAGWAVVARQFQRLLTFLTGDRWEVRFRTAAFPQPARTPNNFGKGGELVADAVCLLSGGLDSFVGAADALADGMRLALVSHNAKGLHRFSSPAQSALVEGMRERFGYDRMKHLKFRLNPPPPDLHTTGKENTQRSRSILFIGLGILVASCLRPGTPLLIPENGFISLNVPLTPARMGSYSTRTTHPYTLRLLAEVLSGLELDVPLVNRYRFCTKGQMVLQLRSRGAALVDQFARRTNSCAHPNERKHDRARPQPHCGYCVPCIIRRASLAAVDLDTAADYRYDVLAERRLLTPNRAKDLKPFEMALARAADSAGIEDVLRSGPIPPMDAEEYTAVYRAGLDEVGRFLLGHAVVP